MSALAHPEWLVPALATLLAAAIAVALSRRLARRRLARLLGGAASLAPARRDVGLLVALAAVLAALVAPLAGERERRVAATGSDLVLLFDVSHSMQAGDAPPSRLARARRAADALLARLGPGDRVALAAFASRGVLLTPLTPDHDALRELLPGLDGELIAPRGSDLGDGVRAALAAFEAGSERPRVLLVLSDGEDSRRGAELPLAELARAEARVLAAAFGSETGATLPDHGALLLDASGRPVVSRLTLAPLARLAQATGGEVFRADALGSLDVAPLVRSLERDAARTNGFVVRREREPLVWPLAALAFALLALEALPAPSALRRRRWRTSAALAVPALLLLAAGPLARPSALRLHESGLERLEQGDADGAARELRAAALASPDPSLAALAYYNLGVALLVAGRLDEASTAFFDALALAPDDAQARFDLEWTLAALARRPPPTPAAPEPEPARARPSPREIPPAARADEPASPRERAQPPVPLDPDQRQQLLDRLPDDPSRSLRASARADAKPAPRRDGAPQW